MLPNEGKIAVYHGTNLFAARIIQRHGIWLDIQRERTDFSRGFYITLNRLQARKWAIAWALQPRATEAMLSKTNISLRQYLLHPDSRVPAYLHCTLDVSRLRRLSGRIFPLPHQLRWMDEASVWRHFVQTCRTGLTHHYDFVYGPVAARHEASVNEVIASRHKVQLSLNSNRAIACCNRQVPLNKFREFIFNN
jgi:hypothetical protein